MPTDPGGDNKSVAKPRGTSARYRLSTLMAMMLVPILLCSIYAPILRARLELRSLQAIHWACVVGGLAGMLSGFVFAMGHRPRWKAVAGAIPVGMLVGAAAGPFMAALPQQYVPLAAGTFGGILGALTITVWWAAVCFRDQLRAMESGQTQKVD